MRLIATIALIFLSLTAKCQDVIFKLADAKHKKWIGTTEFVTSGNEYFTDLTFYANHTVTIFNRRTKNTPEVKKWNLIAGDYLDDSDIILQIGIRQYHVEFSTTTNGKEFMTLTSIPLEDNELSVVKAFYAE